MRILDVVLRDLKIIFSDKKAVGIIIIMPILLTSILSMALKDVFQGDGTYFEQFTVAVVKEYEPEGAYETFKAMMKSNILAFTIMEQSNFLEEGPGFDFEEIFFEGFLDSDQISEMMTYESVSMAEAEKMMKDNEISAIVVLPEDLIVNMYVNILTPFRSPVEIVVIANPDLTVSPAIAKGLVSGFMDGMSGKILSKNVVFEAGMQNGIQKEVFANADLIMAEILDDGNFTGEAVSGKSGDGEGSADSAVAQTRINISEKNIEGEDFVNSGEYYSIAMVSMFILFAASFGSKMLLREKNELTFQRSLVAGAGPWRLLYGKMITIFLIAVVQIGAMILFTTFALKVNWGNGVSVALLTFCSAVSVSGFGTLMGTVAYKSGSYKLTNIMESGIFQVMALFGGSFMPIVVMPKWFQQVGGLTINGAALKGYLYIMLGRNFNELIFPMAVLLVSGILFTLLGMVVLRKEAGWHHVEYN